MCGFCLAGILKSMRVADLRRNLLVSFFFNAQAHKDWQLEGDGVVASWFAGWLYCQFSSLEGELILRLHFGD